MRHNDGFLLSMSADVTMKSFVCRHAGEGQYPVAFLACRDPGSSRGLIWISSGGQYPLGAAAYG